MQPSNTDTNVSTKMRFTYHFFLALFVLSFLWFIYGMWAVRPACEVASEACGDRVVSLFISFLLTLVSAIAFLIVRVLKLKKEQKSTKGSYIAAGAAGLVLLLMLAFLTVGF